MRLVTGVMCVVVFALTWSASAETLALESKSTCRSLRVVRHYEIAARVGRPAVAAVPAMMSFWGETNWQLVKSSCFTYSAPPDSIDITADVNGQPRRYYMMTWTSPNAARITIEQVLEVELYCFNELTTVATLPYEGSVLKRLSGSLGADVKGGINPDNPALGPICGAIAGKAGSAEDAVERVCDWINENIAFEQGHGTSDEALAQRKGSCTPMSLLACAMLRRIGVPAEIVTGKGIGSDGGHSFVEVYFPDAGWIFYDLSNGSRGYKSLDCLITAGWSYLSGTPEKVDWTDGYFCAEKDLVPFTDQPEKNTRGIRVLPNGKKVVGVTVVSQKPPPTVKLRHRSIRELILDTRLPPGTRAYTGVE